MASRNDDTHTAWNPARIERTLAGDSAQIEALLDETVPAIRRRIVRRLQRSAIDSCSGSGHCELEDLTQDVLARLFDRNGAALRRWKPERGLSLKDFVGLFAERHVASVLHRDAVQVWSATAA